MPLAGSQVLAQIMMLYSLLKISGQKIVILGAGGASRAAAYGLIQNDAKVTIVNRTVEKARKIAEKFGCDYEGIEKLRDLIKNSDILVSTLPAKVDAVNVLKYA